MILAMWFMEQKVIIFRCSNDIHDEPANQSSPARPSPARSDPALPGSALTPFYGLFLECVKIYEL